MDNQFEIDEELMDLVNMDESLMGTPESTESIEVIFLNCTGEDSKNQQISKTGYVGREDIAQLSKNSKLPDTITIFARELDVNVFTNYDIIRILFQKARTNIQIIENGVITSGHISKDITYFELRKDVTKLLHYCRDSFEHFDEVALQTMLGNFRTALSSLDAVQTFTTLSTSHSPKGNECMAASHHLVHGNLEWRWLLLTLQLKIAQAAKKDFGKPLRGSPFETELELFVYDLVSISMCKYNKKNQAELMLSTPFGCGCVKEMWLLVVQLVGKLSDMNELNGFWACFNKIVGDVREGRSTYARFAETSATMKIMLRKSSPISCKTPIHFSIWLLCGVTPLFGLTERGEPIGANSDMLFGCDSSKENLEFLNDLLLSYLKTDPSEEKLRALLYTLLSVLDRWSPKPDLIMLLWEHFHKRMNSNFFVTGASLSSLATVSDTAKGYIEQAEQIMATAPNPNHSSYSMFVRALGKMMLRFVQTSQRQQVQKMLGRIYLKFPASKLATLNESGIHNLVTLFVTIALAGDLSEIGPKIVDLLLQMPLDNIAPARQVAVSKAHVAMLLLYHQKQCDMTSYIRKFFAQLKNSCDKPESGACLKVLASGVNEVFGDGQGYFEHGEHLLIDQWVQKFLQQSAKAEQDRLLTTINGILMRLRETPAPSTNDLALAQSIYTFVLPHVKQAFVQGSLSLVIPELAANLTLCATGRDGLPKFADLYRFFIEANCGSVLNTSKFLIHILAQEQRPHIDGAVIIQNWIKCLLMQEESNSMDTTRLTAAVAELDEFRQMYGGDEGVFLTSKDPLRLFFMEIGKKHAEGDYKTKCHISERLSQYLKSFENWATEGLKAQATSFKIFNMIAVIFLYCSKIIYSRSKMSCFFNVVMAQFILPTALLIGKTQPQHLTLAVMRIWHILIEGISHLDYRADAYVTKTISDLITKWTPHFNVGNNAKVAARPYLCLMKNENIEILTYVFDKFSSTFLTAQREPHVNACLALTIASEVFNGISNDQVKMSVFLKSISFHLLQHTMLTDELVPSKNLSYNLLQTILSSSTFRISTDLQNIIVNNLKAIASKYLSLYDKFYFAFMLKLTKSNASLTKEVMTHLKEQISDTEQRRGVAHDPRLRNQFNQLEGAVLAATGR